MLEGHRLLAIAVVSLLLPVSLAGCRQESGVYADAGPRDSGTAGRGLPSAPSPATGGSVDSGYLAGLEPVARDAAERLRQRGVFRVAMIRGEREYEPDAPPEQRGFEYRLALAFAESLGVGLEITSNRSPDQLYADDGVFPEAVMSDPTISYVPDGLRDLDAFAIALAITDWRLRLSPMVPIYPVGISIVGPDAASIRSYEDLDGLTASVVSGEFQLGVLRRIGEEHGVTIEFALRPVDVDAYEALRGGAADFTVDGSIFVASGLEELRDMEVSPLVLSRVAVGWAISPTQEGLAGLVRAFVNQALGDGTVARIWEDTHGVDFDTYLRLVAF